MCYFFSNSYPNLPVKKCGHQEHVIFFLVKFLQSCVRDIFIFLRIISRHFHPFLQQAATLACSFQSIWRSCCEQSEVTQFLFIPFSRAEQHGVEFGCTGQSSPHDYIIHILDHGILLLMQMLELYTKCSLNGISS